MQEQFDIELKTVGTQETGLPPLSAPDLSLAFAFGSGLIMSAFVLAVIGFMESIAVAQAVAGTDSASSLDSNLELVAFGLANFAGAFFTSFPVAGGFSRTAVSAKAGSISQLSGAVTACVVLLALLFLMPLFTCLPYCALACIIEVAVASIIDITAFRTAWSVSKPEFAVSAATAIAVLVLGIELGILIGAAVSIAAVLLHSANPHMARLGRVVVLGANVDLPQPGSKGSGADLDTEPISGVAAVCAYDAGTWRNVARVKDTIEPPRTIILRVDTAITFAAAAAITQEVLGLVAGCRPADFAVAVAVARVDC